MRERSIGLGAMGFHAHLQRHNIPFESAMAKGKNLQMFGELNRRQYVQLNNLLQNAAIVLMEMGSGVRNAHLLAIAPNASSSIICGNTSPSIEPYRANAFTQKTKSGSSYLKTSIWSIFFRI